MTFLVDQLDNFTLSALELVCDFNNDRANGGSTVRSIESALAGKAAYKFYHTKSASQV